MTTTSRYAGFRSAAIAAAMLMVAQFPAHAGTAAAADLARAGEELARVGAASDPTPPCFSCHGISARVANARFPPIVGLPAAYIVDRLNAFQQRARAKAPDPATMMAVAARLDETQVRQLAAYLSTLAPQP